MHGTIVAGKSEWRAVQNHEFYMYAAQVAVKDQPGHLLETSFPAIQTEIGHVTRVT